MLEVIRNLPSPERGSDGFTLTNSSFTLVCELSVTTRPGRDNGVAPSKGTQRCCKHCGAPFLLERLAVGTIATAAALVLGGAAWYARRRLLRSAPLHVGREPPPLPALREGARAVRTEAPAAQPWRPPRPHSPRNPPKVWMMATSDVTMPLFVDCPLGRRSVV